MNATSAKALTAIKQKIKKATRDNEAILAEYKGVRACLHANVHTA
jgi:hypothetical protein